jgi:hypothetical protein
VGGNADGRLEVFSRSGGDVIHEGGHVFHIQQVAPNDGWGSWNQLGPDEPNIAPDAVGNNADGRLEVFARDPNDGQVWHMWQVPGGWVSWKSLGGATTDPPVVTNNQDGRLEAFARGVNGDLVNIWQTTPNGGWSGWASLGRPV